MHFIASPGATPLLLFVSTETASTPIPTPYGPFALAPPFVPGFPVLIPGPPGSGHLAIPVAVPSSIPQGLDVFLQAFSGAPDLVLSEVVEVSFE